MPPGAVKAEAGLIHEETSYHQYIQVVERPDGRRVLHLNEGVAVHSVWQPDSVLTGGVWDAFLAVPPLLGRPLERVAILGNAAGTTARALGVYYPDADVDGVELDPAVSRVGRRYFEMGDNPRLTVHDADARPFLRSTDERYDLIVVDAYHQPYVPFYLATREFFRLVRDRLAPGGIVALNVAAVPDDKRLVRAIGRTVGAELPQVLEWPALRFNTIVLGLTRPLSREELERRLRAGPEDVAPLRELLAQGREAARGVRARVDRRPRTGRVAHRPDDHRLRGRGGKARRGLPPDPSASYSVISLERRDGRPLRIGHRGAAALAPENTLRAFRAARDAGVDLIEFDVLDLRGGELVVAHSDDLHEVSHGAAHGSVRESTLQELRAACPELPTLDEALAFFADEAPDVGVHVDLKSAGAVDGLAVALGRFALGDRTLVSSFEVDALRRLAVLEPRVRIGISFPEDRIGIQGRRGSTPAIRGGLLALRPLMPLLAGRLLARAGASALVLHHALVGSAVVRAAHARGAAVVGWTVRDRTRPRTDRQGGRRRGGR